MSPSAPSGPRRRPVAPASTAAPLLAAATLLAATACAEGDSATAGAWEATVDTVADTVVVRTTAGMAWSDTMEMVPEVEIGVLEGAEAYMFGRVTALAVDDRGRIWAVDRQVPEIRVFDASGEHVMTVGRPGEGPGELSGPDGGFAILPDGRAAVRDPSNARIQIYGPDGEPLDTWTIRGNFNSSNPFGMDREGNIYTQVLMDPEASLDEWQMGLAKITPEGVSTDTLPVPDAGFEAAFVDARTENSWSRSSVPFSPSEHWAFHPDGYFVHGISDDYSFTLLRDPATGEPPLRIEREWQPVPVASGEADEERGRTTRNMRSMIPDWTWNGPAIPDAKPAFEDILVGQDGRIWLRVPTPGYRVEDPEHDPSDPESVADEWREGVAFDVFEADGRFLGHVRAPDDFSMYPTPVIDGDRVWAVTRDDLGVNRVVRYRLEPAATP